MHRWMTLVLMLLIPTLHGMDVKSYREAYEGSSETKQALFDWYLQGLGAGLAWSNTQLEASKPPRQPLFCPPPNLVLNVENYKALIDTEIKRERRLGELYGKADAGLSHAQLAAVDKLSVELILLDALMETFPCRGAQSAKKK